MRTSMRLSVQPDEEDYDLEALGMISDGFRPGAMQQMSTSQPAERRQSIINSYTNQNPPPRPSSISKPKGLLASNSFALQNDGGLGPLSERSIASGSSGSPHATRSMSVSTTTSSILPLEEAPYTGPLGPSHQYGMYPQTTRLARTASVATTSTAQGAPSVYSGPSGPTHPYGMYPQNTMPEPESEQDRLPIANIPVGFPGLRNDFQRRIGPEGEESADIIGEDGHTEQLPPYTQYPDEAFARKAGLATVAATHPALINHAIPAPAVMAGGLGLATRNPEFESREDLAGTPQSRMSSRSGLSDASHHQINMAAAELSEKPPLKKWQIIARRKLWNVVPIWVVVLLAITFLLMGAILGGVLGALSPKHHKQKGHHGDDSSVPPQ
jgi:hypothetical protein